MINNPEKLDISKIKVIIWDMGNAFWDGTITDDEVQPIQKNIDLKFN